MTSVKLSFKFLLIHFAIQTAHPDSWNELSEKQFIRLVQIIKKGYITESDRIRLIKTLLNIKARVFLKLGNLQIIQLLELSDFLQEEKYFNNILIKELKTSKGKLYGPGPRLENVEFEEFAFADTLFNKYSTTKQQSYLDQMIAVLYRPKSKNYNPTAADYYGDIREIFNKHNIEFRAKLINEVPHKIKEAIVFNYKAVRVWIENRYPNIFPQPIPGEKRKTTSDNSLKWSKIIRDLTDGHITNRDEVARLPLHHVLSEIEDRIISKRK